MLLQFLTRLGKPKTMDFHIPLPAEGPRPFYGARHGLEFETPRSPLPEPRITYLPGGGIQAELPMPDLTVGEAVAVGMAA